MSTAIAIGSHWGAALVTDSLRIDLTARTWQTGFRKHVRVGRTAAALVGVSDFEGRSYIDALEVALDATRGDLLELGANFLRVCGSDIVRAYHAWRATALGTDRGQDFLQIVYASRRGGRTRIGEFYADVTADALGMPGHEYRPRREVAIVTAGHQSDALEATTNYVRRLNRERTVTGQPLALPRKPVPSAMWMSSQGCTRWASGQLQTLLDEPVEPRRRPAALPKVVPLSAGPLHIEQLD